MKKKKRKTRKPVRGSARRAPARTEKRPAPVAPEVEGEFPVARALLATGAFSLVLIWPLFLPAVYASHDTRYHLAQFAQFIAAFLDGQWHVRWAPDLMGGYGLPVFIIYPSLPHYLGLLFHTVGLDLFASFKLTLALGGLLSGISMFFFAADFMPRRAALLAGVAYMFFPFHIIDIYVRGAFLEAMAFPFVPLVFLGVYRTVHRKGRAIPLLALAVAGLALTHTITTMLVLPCAAAFGLVTVFTAGKPQRLLDLAIGGLIGLGVSSVYWLVAFAEMEHTTVTTSAGGLKMYFKNHFFPWNRLVSPRWAYHGETPKLVGYPYLIALVLVSVAVFRRRTFRRDVTPLFFLVLSLVTLFMMFEVSLFLWESVPLIRFAQFPWRYLNLLAFPASFTLAMLGTLLRDSPTLGKWARRALLVGPPLMMTPFLWLEEDPGLRRFDILVFAILIGLAVLTPFWQRWRLPGWSVTDWTALVALVVVSIPLCAVPLHRAIHERPRDLKERYRQISPEQLRATMNTGGHGHMFLPRTVKRLPRGPRTAAAEVVSGDGVIRDLSQGSDWQAFRAEVRTPSRIRINVFYFPGWQVTVDGRAATVDLDPQGRMNIDLPVGIHGVRVRFGDTPVRKIAYGVSAVSIIALGFLFFVFPRRRRAN
jgi:hypothetical protein